MEKKINSFLLVLFSSILLLFSCSKNPITTHLTNSDTTTSADSTTTTIDVKQLKYLCIYYGWPSLVNGSNGDLTKATQSFEQFDLIVLGDGIWKADNADNANTTTIIGNLNLVGKTVYGYVDLGVSTQNLSYENMKLAVDGWKSMGAKGIFWDDAGYDYSTTRARQDTMINYCHAKGLSVIMNAWTPADVLGGDNVLLDSTDTYLLESYLVSSNKYSSLTAWQSKASACAAYQSSLGVKMACLSSSDATITSTYNTTDMFTQAWIGAAIYNFDYFQLTDNNYSASNNIVYYFPNISDNYGSTWTSSTVADSANVNFYRSTETSTLHVRGDGSSWGYGQILQP
ncbi:NADPH-dependent FMN reductase family protein [Rhizosphaericola mali]|uniref:Uncharacterized protein n=1 Tax=Rhizosphaericola mali TaxID=2545455 RepID=A0A5P2GAG3_9BACT|nr:hypothetical protein [Rhizosphaericola mali]QES90690.1 hypothetical protein E0W69_019210 [Rhizosphaericola mali]